MLDPSAATVTPPAPPLKGPECSTEGCPGVARVRGLCRRCYGRTWDRARRREERGEAPGFAFRRPEEDRPRSVEACGRPGCNLPAFRDGACIPHLAQDERGQVPGRRMPRDPLLRAVVGVFRTAEGTVGRREAVAILERAARAAALL